VGALVLMTVTTVQQHGNQCRQAGWRARVVLTACCNVTSVQHACCAIDKQPKDAIKFRQHIWKVRYGKIRVIATVRRIAAVIDLRRGY
jgi:hypothetical protein